MHVGDIFVIPKAPSHRSLYVSYFWSLIKGQSIFEKSSSDQKRVDHFLVMILFGFLLIKLCAAFTFSGTLELSGKVIRFKRKIAAADFETQKRFCQEEGQVEIFLQKKNRVKILIGPRKHFWFTAYTFY